MLCVLITCPAWGQEPPRRLYGQIIDDERDPLVGVQLRLEGTQIETRSDNQGFFVFENVPLGTVNIASDRYTIHPSRIVTHEQPQPIIIQAHRLNGPDYTMTVVASRPHPLIASTSHITGEEIATVPRRNAEDALRLVPGFTLVQHGSEGKGHQFFLRGFDAIHGADLELTVAGIPVNEWSNIHAQGYIDLGFIIPETVASVEVTKGPFTLKQGAFATAGSADYTLGLPESSLGIQAIYTIGTTNRHRGVLTYSPTAGDGKNFIAVEAMHDDGFGENREINRGTILGQARVFDSTTYGTLSIIASSYLARFALPGTLRNEDVVAGRVGFYDAYDSAGLGLSARSIVSLTYSWQTGVHDISSVIYGGYRQLELIENYTGFLINPLSGDRRKQQQITWNFGATVNYNLRLMASLDLEAGIGTRGDVLNQTQRHINQQKAPLETERDLSGVQSLSHMMVGLLFRPIDRLRLAAGARVDTAYVSVQDGLAARQPATGTMVTISPRVTAEWHVFIPWRLFAAYGRGFRPPEARSFTSFEPELTGISEDIYDGGRPSTTVTDSIELGSRWTPNHYFSAAISGFTTFIEQETVFDHVSGVNLELNQTRRLGLELSVQSRPMSWLTLHADMTYVDARFVNSGNRIPLAPPLVGNFRAFAQHNSGIQGGIRVMGLAPRPLPNGAKGSPMTVLDATAGYKGDRIRVNLEVENVLNLRIREGEYHYASHWRPGEESSELPVVQYIAGAPLNVRLSISTLF